MRREQVMAWFLALLALVPALLFAYMGQFSRLMADDYCNMALGKEYGAIGFMIRARGLWAGSYSNYFLRGLLSTIDVPIPSVFPIFIIGFWMIALTWFFLLILGRLSFTKSWLAVALTFAACVVTATINGLHSQQSYFWFAGSVAYTLPLAILVFYISLVIHTASRSEMKQRIAAAAVVGAVICFVNGGFAEMYLVFQGTFLTGLLVGITMLVSKSVRRPYVILIGAGWIATAASAIVQITAPGFHIRAAALSRIFGPSFHSLPDLVARTAELTFQYLGHEEAFAGFMMLFGIGLCAALLIEVIPPSRSEVALAGLAKQPLWLGLIVQLLFIAILWTHSSDDPQVLGRFSRAFFTVVSLNLALVAFFLLLIWQRRRVEELLQNSQKGYLFLSGAILLMVLVMFAATQIRSIHYKAATYLFVSSMTLLGILSWQLALNLSDSRATTFGLVAGMTLAMTAVTLAVLIGAGLIGGHLVARTMAPAAFVQVFPGLIWGACAGYLIRRSSQGTLANIRWLRWIGLSGLLIALAIGVGIVLGQASFIPDLGLYAHEWDKRHQLILRQRDSGLAEVEVTPLSFDFSWHLLHEDMSTALENGCALNYYGLLSISVIGNDE